MKLSFINKMILVMGMTLSFACSAAAAAESTGEMASRRVPSIARVCDRLKLRESQSHEQKATTRPGGVGAAQ